MSASESKHCNTEPKLTKIVPKLAGADLFHILPSPELDVVQNGVIGHNGLVETG